MTYCTKSHLFSYVLGLGVCVYVARRYTLLKSQIRYHLKESAALDAAIDCNSPQWPPAVANSPPPARKYQKEELFH